tara:strand:+ start:5340 stop:6773 length:1434 start_codon:yes stop_codon:yes gene_type:complete
MQLNCESGIAAELKEYFSFYVPGYKFMPAYRNRVWDGKIRLFNDRNGEIPVGLYDHILTFAEKREYEIVNMESDYGEPDSYNQVNSHKLYKYIEKLKLPWEIRDYQFNAIATGIHKKRAILVSPTGSGKSLIIYCLMKWYLHNYDKKVLVIVPTTSLVEQMHNDFIHYGTNESELHRIYSGKDKQTEKRIIISTWQSVYKLTFDWFSQFGAVFGDECHGFKSKSLMSIMNKAKEAEYRFGTTGTLDGTQTHELVLQGLFGKVYKVTTTKALQENETLAGLDIKIINLIHDQNTRKEFGKKTYQEEIDYIIGKDSRNNFIRNLALDQNGNTLVLFQYVEKHGKKLYEIIRNKAKTDRKIFYVSGETPTSDREAIRGIVEKQKDAIIIASLGTFSTGINIKNLNNIIFASPSKSQIRVLQSIGRGLRQGDNKEITNLYDISDDITWKKRQNFTWLHSQERIKIYKNERFNYKNYQVELT